MTYLLLSILCSTAIALIFKVYAQRQVDIFQTIIANYYCAAICGFILQGDFNLSGIADKEWTYVAMLLGILFISGFYAMGMTVKHFGVSLGMLTSKMSIIISVTAAFILFSESFSWMKIAGILVIALSIYLVSRRDEVKQASLLLLLFPVYLWLASGFIEILLKLAEDRLNISNDINIFNSSIFGTAGLIGSIVLLLLLLSKRTTFSGRSWILGIPLGLVNYFSIYYALKTLELPQFPASIFYPVNNVAIICLSILLAWLLLSEKLSKVNILGIAFAIIGILMISIYG